MLYAGNTAGLESIGELVYGMAWYQALCICGEKFRDCVFWSSVRRRYEKISGESWDDAVWASAGQANVRNLPRTTMA